MQEPRWILVVDQAAGSRGDGQLLVQTTHMSNPQLVELRVFRNGECGSDRLYAWRPNGEVNPEILCDGYMPRIPLLVQRMGLTLCRVDMRLTVKGVVDLHPKMLPGVYIMGNTNVVVTFCLERFSEKLGLVVANISLSESFEETPLTQADLDRLQCSLMQILAGEVIPANRIGPPAGTLQAIQMLALPQLRELEDDPEHQ